MCQAWSEAGMGEEKGESKEVIKGQGLAGIVVPMTRVPCLLLSGN